MKIFLAAVLALPASLALAAGADSGTSTVGELNITGTQFLMMLGALAALGALVWLMIKVASK